MQAVTQHIETQKHLQFTPKVEHAYITVYKEDADQFIYDYQNKKLTTRELCETVR
jgi:hypothetical protein